MIIIFTPDERPTPRPRAAEARGTHQPRFTPNRPLPDPMAEEEAVFTDPFGAPGTSAR